MERFVKLLFGLIFLGLNACNDGSQNDTGMRTDIKGSEQLASPTYPMPTNNFRLSLTDAPLENASNVNIEIENFELWIQKGDQKARVITGEETGLVDLLELKDNFLLPISNLDIGDGIEITHIRLMLKPEGHHVVFNNQSTCPMKTPSGQTSGVKIKLKEPLIIEEGYSYSLVLDFDANKSVVVAGNSGKCNLKPVIRIESLTRVPINSENEDNEDCMNSNDSVVEDGNQQNMCEGEETIEDGDDSSNDQPYDDTPDEDLPPDIPDDDINF